MFFVNLVFFIMKSSTFPKQTEWQHCGSSRVANLAFLKPHFEILDFVEVLGFFLPYNTEVGLSQPALRVQYYLLM